MVAIRELRSPWEGLGTDFNGEKGITGQEILEKSGLDWEVIKTPSAGWNPVSSRWEEDTHGAKIMRLSDQKILGTVGNRYEPLQNIDMMDIVADVINKTGGGLAAVGTFNEGKVIWAQVKVGDPIAIFGNDEVTTNFTILNSHDGSVSMQTLLTPLRLFCSNVLAAMKAEARSSSSAMSFRHTASARERIADVASKIAEGAVLFKESVELYKHLATKQLNSDMLNMLLRAVFPSAAFKDGERIPSRRHEEVLSLYEGGRGTQNTPHTLWRAWNAIVEWVDYYRGRSQDSRVRAAINGAGLRIKRKALDITTKIANGTYVEPVLLPPGVSEGDDLFDEGEDQ